MALAIKNAQRFFVIKEDNKEIKLPDPNPEWLPQEVLKFYSGKYPEITNAIIEGPKIKNDVATYSMSPTLGNKG